MAAAAVANPLSPSPSPSPIGSGTSGLLSPTGFANAGGGGTSISLNEFSLFQLQLTVPEDKLGFLSTFLQEDYGYITKLQASLAWVLVFRVSAAQLPETLKSLSALGVGVYFGVVDVIPIWFSVPSFLRAPVTPSGPQLDSTPSSLNNSTASLNSLVLSGASSSAPTPSTAASVSAPNSNPISPDQPPSQLHQHSTTTTTTTVGSQQPATMVLSFQSQSSNEGPLSPTPFGERGVNSSALLPFLLEPFRTEMNELLHGAPKENKDALERYRSGRVLFASLKTFDHLPKSALSLPTAVIRKGSDEASRSPPVVRDPSQPTTPTTPSPRDPLKKARRGTPNNLEGMFRRFSIEVDAREQTAPTQAAGPTKVVGFNAPVTTASPTVVVGFSLPQASSQPGPTAASTTPTTTPPGSQPGSNTTPPPVAGVLPSPRVRPTPPPRRDLEVRPSPAPPSTEATKHVRVFLSDGTSRTFTVTPTETVQALVQRMIRKFAIPPAQVPFYRLFERTDRKTERQLRPEEIVYPLYESQQADSLFTGTEDLERCLIFRSTQPQLEEDSNDGSLTEHKAGMGKVLSDIRTMADKSPSSREKEKKRGFFLKKKSNG